MLSQLARRIARLCKPLLPHSAMGRTAQDVVGVGHLYALAVREGHVPHAARGCADRIGLVGHLRLADAIELVRAACSPRRAAAVGLGFLTLIPKS